MTAVEVAAVEAVTVVHIHGDLDEALAPELRETLGAAVECSADVVVDLSEAPIVDPAGLGVLVRAHRRARRQGGNLCLVAPSRFVLTVLHTMHVDGVFPIFDDCVSALGWLGADTAALGHLLVVEPGDGG
jgi:anti-sigma B factor antagonist